jgi:hypothetical protein
MLPPPVLKLNGSPFNGLEEGFENGKGVEMLA